MTYKQFDTQKERGQMLVKLKGINRMFGREMVDIVTFDYLPLMLQFLQSGRMAKSSELKRIFN